MQMVTQNKFETIAAIKFVSMTDNRNWGFNFGRALGTEYGMCYARDYVAKFIHNNRGKVVATYYVPLNENAEKTILEARWEFLRNANHTVMTSAEVNEEIESGNYCKYL